MAADHTQFVFMGTITKPHGIRGEMALHTNAETPNVLLGKAFLALPSPASPFEDAMFPPGSKPITIAKVRNHHQTVLITVEGIEDRTAAENLRRHRVFIDRQKLPELGEDVYYQTDLLGLDVFVDTREEASFLGTLTYIDTPAGQEIWTITTHDGQEILLPAVPDFVDIIDLDENCIIITPPPGLIELYTESAASKDD